MSPASVAFGSRTTRTDACATQLSAATLHLLTYCTRASSDGRVGQATLGGSSGGCAAFSMAFFRPDLFRRVLTYSGTYTNQQSPFNAETPHGHWELHSGLELIANSDPKPLKVAAEPDLSR